jgi:L-threonylcarbamoyladenylate synthase
LPRLRLTPETESLAVERAAAVLRGGGIALLPAEGVYGYHVLAASSAAVARLRVIKARAPEQRFIGLVARSEDLGAYAETPAPALDLARAHWPGALTLVLPTKPGVLPDLVAADRTIALRCPGSAFLRSVVVAAGGLLLSTSANEPGGPPAVRFDQVAAEAYDIGVDGGELSGVPSTIVRIVTGVVQVLRQGAVRVEEPPLDGRAVPP